MVLEDELQGGLNVVFQQSVALATKIMFDVVKDAFHSCCLGWQANSIFTARASKCLGEEGQFRVSAMGNLEP